MSKLYFQSGVILFLLLLLGCSSPDSGDIKIDRFWKKYVKIIRAKDLQELKEVSLPKIYCEICLENSSSEDSVITNFKIENPDKWYDKLYGELAYIPIDKFIEQDFDSLFNPGVLSKIKKPSNVNFISREFETSEGQSYLQTYLNEGKKYTLYEALITTVEPSTQFEGAQIVIQFLETEEGLMFYGYSTIP